MHFPLFCERITTGEFVPEQKNLQLPCYEGSKSNNELSLPSSSLFGKKSKNEVFLPLEFFLHFFGGYNMTKKNQNISMSIF